MVVALVDDGNADAVLCVSLHSQGMVLVVMMMMMMMMMMLPVVVGRYFFKAVGSLS